MIIGSDSQEILIVVFIVDTVTERTMSNNTILKGLVRIGYKGRLTGHGFRGLASMILHERDYPQAHIEPSISSDCLESGTMCGVCILVRSAGMLQRADSRSISDHLASMSSLVRTKVKTISLIASLGHFNLRYGTRAQTGHQVRRQPAPSRVDVTRTLPHLPVL